MIDKKEFSNWLDYKIFLCEESLKEEVEKLFLYVNPDDSCVLEYKTTLEILKIIKKEWAS